MTSEIMHKARLWLEDMGAGNLIGYSNDQLRRVIDRAYNGGWNAFVAESA